MENKDASLPKKIVRKIYSLVLDVFLALLKFVDKVGNVRFVFLSSLFVVIVLALLKGDSMEVRPSFSLGPTSYGFFTNAIKGPIAINSSVPFPPVTAEAILVIDIPSSRVLYEKNIDLPLAPASTTKIMTALVSMDMYQKEAYLLVPEDCASIEGTKLGLLPEEQLRFVDLMNALLISSANDAACVLARGKMSESNFVEEMNLYAKNLGLEKTHFTNPAGLDAADGSHYSSAKDLLMLALEARNDAFLSNIYSRKEYTVLSGDFPRKVYSTNQLLWQLPESVGIKTGTTEQAKEVLIYEYSEGPKDLIIILMGSEDRFLETRLILDWVLEKYTWK